MKFCQTYLQQSKIVDGKMKCSSGGHRKIGIEGVADQ